MKDSSKEVLNFVKENDVKFIRLAFCDNLGIQKNISLQPGELERAFESGIPFNASELPGLAKRSAERRQSVIHSMRSIWKYSDRSSGKTIRP